MCNTLPYSDGITGAEMLAALRDCAARLPRTGLRPLRQRRDPERRLTIGLLSGTLKTHPVGLADRRRDRDARSGAVRRGVPGAERRADDPIARRFRAAAREWIEIDAMDDVALATRARELGIDVLIDLGGYGDAARMPACAHRLAPVQVKWVGMQNHSTGLPEMDWFITDRWETPPELELCIPSDCCACRTAMPATARRGYAPDVVPLPALANGHITFGCFNNLAKVTPRVIATWAAVLHRVPGSRLVLKTHQFGDRATADRLRDAFADAGHRRERAWSCVGRRRIAPSWASMGDRHRAGPVSLFRGA